MENVDDGHGRKPRKSRLSSKSDPSVIRRHREEPAEVGTLLFGCNLTKGASCAAAVSQHLFLFLILQGMPVPADAVFG